MSLRDGFVRDKIVVLQPMQYVVTCNASCG